MDEVQGRIQEGQAHDPLVLELEDRYENYAILSRLLREEVDRELLADLRDSPVAEATGNAAFDEGYARLRAYLDGIDDLAKAKSELAIDYCLAFVGYGVDPATADDDTALHAAYPYESVYTSGSKTLTSGLVEGVALLFRQNGFQPTRPRILADDHIACELEFMQFLVGRELAIARDGEEGSADELRATERAFLDEHLLAWIDAFAKAVDQRAETDFYRALVCMTKGWLQEDRASVD